MYINPRTVSVENAPIHLMKYISLSWTLTVAFFKRTQKIANYYQKTDF